MRKLVILVTTILILGAVAVLPASAAYSCPGSLPPRLSLGSHGQIAQTFSTLRNAPGGAPIQIMYAPATFTVVEGPSCDGYLTYFRIQYDNGGPSGWATESQIYSPWGYNQYWLEPTNAPPPPPPPPPNTTCPGSLPTQLQVGQQGHIAEVFSTLRSSPGGPPIQIMYAPATFTVLAGPASDGYLCYFQIQYANGPTGWATESEIYSIYGNNRYWLLPN